ncbi:hypothetical protein [Flavobacterium sp. Root420]|uniref:hypothetical protein n=1 Tax=Flavobacterium sp. Root420 TaxID=1736533 RepID=UPI0006FA94F3|nr:hypothetical protein [Flavobacterium sp. Root420]KQX09906.1 hypothetical protein ASC72_21735 [Flavobacterium sp. Root420]
MEAQITLSNPGSSLKYGVTEKKKAELDVLQSQVIDTQAEVLQQQIIVASLTEKSKRFQDFLLGADNYRTVTLNNKTLVDQVIQNAYDLSYNSKNAFSKMTTSNENTKQVALGTNDLINKLIYSVEIINKLSNLVIRKKALNPLISDDLISRINTAGSDANNAVALTLIALKSILAAEASSLEAEASITLESKQALKLYFTLSGKESIDMPLLSANAVLDISKEASIRDLIYEAYNEALRSYNQTDAANDETTRQLSIATNNLNKAQIKLASFQSALAAANAAALAS